MTIASRLKVSMKERGQSVAIKILQNSGTKASGIKYRWLTDVARPTIGKATITPLANRPTIVLRAGLLGKLKTAATTTMAANPHRILPPPLGRSS